MKVLVIGFNSRPIVESAVKAGYRVVCVDRWGDMDLVKKCEEVISFKDTPLSQDRETFYLDAVKKLVYKHQDICFSLIGSGFDDSHVFWREVNKHVPILGNRPDTIKKSRNWRYIFKLLSSLGINHPVSIMANNESGVLKAVDDLKPPVVLKPLPYGGGGVGKKLIKSVEEVPIGLKGKFIVQEFINGVDASASFISNKETCWLISVNNQLIGTKWLYSPGRFTYCGNIVPLTVNKSIRGKIKEMASFLVSEFKLVGSNGIDLILKNGEPYFLELNPRFQGSLECIEEAFNINIVKLHINSCLNGKIDLKATPKRYSGRGILFSPRNLKIGDLWKYNFVEDIPFPGSMIKKKSPICSIRAVSKRKREVIKMLKLKASTLLSKATFTL